MFQKAFSFAGTLLLSGAAVLVMPALSQAQHGGGHGGGGHFGGAHSGGGHFDGVHFGGGHSAGYGGGIYHAGSQLGGYGGGTYHGAPHDGGYHYGHPYAHYGDRHYRPYYGFYSYGYPYYGFSGSDYPYYYDNYPYISSSPTYDSGFNGYAGDLMPSYADGTTSAAPSASNYQTFYPPASITAPSDSNAHVTVKAPADARVWFEGMATTSTGPVRQFASPPLAPGSRYTYEVRARWSENGHEVTQTRQVEVTAGANVEVDFPLLSKTAGTGVGL